MSLGREVSEETQTSFDINVLFSLVTGTLKGYDQLMNLVLDNVNEVTRGKSNRRFTLPGHAANKKTNLPSDEEGNTSTRSLGLLVARGTLLVLISPVDGSEEIENPFVQGEDEE